VSGWRDTLDDAEVHAGEVYSVLERLGADEELLAIVGSWRDTLPDAEVLALPRSYNATGKALHLRR
jgi:hypothetical protein